MVVFRQVRSAALGKRLATVSIIALGLGGISGQAYAQAPAADEQIGFGDIIVTARKVEENLQDVPVSVTAFSGDRLETQGVREVGEIAKFTPGFNIRGSGNNPTAFALSMRGQVQNDNLATLEPSVGIYMDDMYIARSYGLNVEMLDVANVQVLKGPQGTLFGRNTSAGAVLIQTADPKFGENLGKLQATYGRFNERSGTAVLNLGLGEDVALRGALYYGKRDGYKTDVHTGHKYEGRETLNGRLKLAFKPTDNLEVLLSGEWYDGKIDGQARQNLFFRLTNTFDPAAADRALFAGNPDRVAVTQPASVPGTPARGIFNDMKTQTYMAKIKLESAIGEIKWINGYRKIKGANLLDLDGSSQVTGNHFTAGTQNLKQYSSELQLTGSALGDAVDYAVGMTYFKEKGTDDSRSSTNGSAVWSGFSGDINNDSMGVYGQASYHATDALTFTGGLRYSVDDKGVTTQSAAFPNNGTTFAACLPNPAQSVGGVPLITPTAYAALVANQCRRGRSDSFNNLSYTAGLDYKLGEDILVYAKHSKGYRSGAQQLRTLTLTDTTPAQPEIVHEQEIGLKTTFMDGKVRFNVAGYRNKVSNAQRSVILSIGGINQTVLENASTETWGGEVDINVRVAKGLDVFAAGALTDPKYTAYNGFVAFAGALTPNDKSDTQFTGIVRKQFSVGTNYAADVGFARLKFNATYAWQSKMSQTELTVARLSAATTTPGGSGFTVAQAEAAIKAATTRAYGTTNLRAALAFGPDDNYELAVWGRNVFNERATVYSLLLGGLNYVGTSWNDPATYGVTATVKF